MFNALGQRNFALSRQQANGAHLSQVRADRVLRILRSRKQLGLGWLGGLQGIGRKLIRKIARLGACQNSRGIVLGGQKLAR